MKFIAIIASLVSMLSMVDHASAICHHNTDLFSRSELSARADSPAFGYHELSGALNWHGLSSNNSLCAVGKNQSPVSFQSSQATLRGQSLSFSPNNKPQGAEFLNLGTTVEVLADGSANIRNKRYNLKQFHFHTPSEHHLNGAYFPAEVHFVFQAADSSTAVIGFLLEISTAGEATSNVMEAVLSKVRNIPALGNSVQTPALHFDALKEHIRTSTVFQYDGSLTTPPCSENIVFNVVAKPLYITPATYRALKDIVKFNSRFTQDIPGQINLLDNARNVLDA